jgi:probable rRNA maturation factor
VGTSKASIATYCPKLIFDRNVFMADVLITSSSRYPVSRKRIRAVVEKVLAEKNIQTDLTVSVSVVGARKMRSINAQFHGEDYATDVLSFPYLDPESSQDYGAFVMPDEERTVLGDLVLCYPTVIAQAQEKNVLVDDEVDFLVEHGMLHLLGFHHD